jgi:hypothetical protein
MRWSLVVVAASVLAVLAGASPAQAEMHTCLSRAMLPQGGWQDTEVKLTVVGGKVTAISFFEGGASVATGGTGCYFEAAAADGGSAWSYSGLRTVIATDHGDLDARSHLEIVRLWNGYQVSFLDMWSGNCGDGVSFPAAVRVVNGQRGCSVTSGGT